MLYLLSLNGTFDRKTIHVPFEPDKLRIGRQTNQRTVPTPSNGYFDSKVLSRQHAEIWADRTGKIWIRDVKSSNGTFVNGSRLSPENRESEPHELQTADHLELGIDIVSEDQKTVVHHKVAAKVEHAGFLSATSNLLDMNFGDLDPANGSAMPPTPGTMHMRSRMGGASMAGNGRTGAGAGMMNPQATGMPQQRGYWLTPITAEQIVKRLQVCLSLTPRSSTRRSNCGYQSEMRSARLQSQDLERTGKFLTTLLSKDDVKDMEKPEVPEPPKQQSLVNGSGLPFRADPKARFSEPPAPPPQQPLPEKPDIPALKRGVTDRSKPQSNTSPIRDNVSAQIIQLQEDLKNTKKELEGRDARLRELEESLQKERTARETAEELARRLEDAAAASVAVADEQTDVSSEPPLPVKANGTAKGGVSVDDILDEAFAPPRELAVSEEAGTLTPAVRQSLADQTESIQTTAEEYQSRVDAMASEIKVLKDQLELWRQRCEAAEAERDADRQTLAEKVAQIRREEEERQAAAAAAATRRSKSRGRSESRRSASRKAQESGTLDAESEEPMPLKPDSEPDRSAPDDGSDKPTLSRANTITPQAPFAASLPHDQKLAASLPYASMLGVVLLGVGLMAYINGWQPPPKR